MKIEDELVWYASYGSNINKERFLCYIRGGQPTGAAKNYKGCNDPTLPRDNEELYISSDIYFAKNSTTWGNGGVGFLRNNFNSGGQTWGRMYLITKSQFIDVVKQEMGGKDIEIDFEKTLSRNYIFAPGSWYGMMVYLGDHRGYPIFTFTHEKEIPSTKPSPAYLKTIVAGIKECYPYSDLEIADYLITKSGVYDNYTIQELVKMVIDK